MKVSREPTLQRRRALRRIGMLVLVLASGCRDHVWTIAVPRWMRSVWTAAAAQVGSRSTPPAPPIVAHTQSMPARSASAMCATASLALDAWIDTPITGVLLPWDAAQW